MVWKIFSKKSKKKKKVISYEEAKALAVDGDEKSRADLAGRNDVPEKSSIILLMTLLQMFARA